MLHLDSLGQYKWDFQSISAPHPSIFFFKENLCCTRSISQFLVFKIVWKEGKIGNVVIIRHFFFHRTEYINESIKQIKLGIYSQSLFYLKI